MEFGAKRNKKGILVNPVNLGLYGEQDKRVDLQGRIALPSRYKEMFNGGVLLQRGYDCCINIWPPSAFEPHPSHISALSLNTSKERRQRRNVFSATYNAEIDRQGRVLLPPRLREYAHIREEVVITGMGSFFELRAKDEWELERETLETDSLQIAESIEDYR